MTAGFVYFCYIRVNLVGIAATRTIAVEGSLNNVHNSYEFL